MCGNWLKICIGFYYFILEQSDDVDVKLDALFFFNTVPLWSFSRREFSLWLPPLDSAFVAFHW